ncbi:MAG: G5 domain-containing protein, partial [Christensenellaceae bacterium]|nr:G5 domain-containing protein [Christensenellaceae bacterium]
PQGEIEYRVDKTQKPDYHKVFAERKNGSVYQSYKNYYKNGELVKTEKLAETTYPARNGITIVGPGYLSPSPGLTTPGTNTPNPNTPNPNTPNPNTPDPNTPNPETPNPNTPDPEPNTPDPEVPVG